MGGSGRKELGIIVEGLRFRGIRVSTSTCQEKLKVIGVIKCHEWRFKVWCFGGHLIIVVCRVCELFRRRFRTVKAVFSTTFHVRFRARGLFCLDRACDKFAKFMPSQASVGMQLFWLLRLILTWRGRSSRKVLLQIDAWIILASPFHACAPGKRCVSLAVDVVHDTGVCSQHFAGSKQLLMPSLCLVYPALCCPHSLASRQLGVLYDYRFIRCAQN